MGERKAKALEGLRDERKRKVGFLSQMYGRKEVDCVTEVKGITVANTLDNRVACQQHVENDPVVTEGTREHRWRRMHILFYG